MTPIRILLDTGIGNNIDDAFALALASNSPEISLLGITTVGNEGSERAILARRLLSAYGHSDTPVAAGDTPPFSPLEGARFTQRALAVSDNSSAQPPQAAAVTLMAETIRRNPGLTIVATGPLTNVASLLTDHPGVARDIARIVFMGGWPSQDLPEDNISEDPKAAMTIFNTTIPLTMVGYEVTLGAALRLHHLRQLESALGTGPGFLRMMYREWTRIAHVRQPIMHDPVTIALLVKPTLVEVQKMQLSVSMEGSTGSGIISPDGATGRYVDVCVDIQTESYLRLLISRVAPEPILDPNEYWDSSKFHLVLREAYQTQHFPGWTYQRKPQRDEVLIVITDGDGVIKSCGETSFITRGSMLFLDGRQTYDLRTKNGTSACWFRFSLRRSDDHPVTTRPFLPSCVTLPPSALVSAAASAQRVLDHWRKPGIASSFYYQADMYELLGRHLEVSLEGQMAPKGSRHALVIRVKRLLEARLDETVTLEEIGRHVDLTSTHVQKVFKEMVGVTPHQYQTHLRMYLAKQLLRMDDAPVKEIASRVGFGSAEAFSRAFHREVGCSPVDFRQ